MMKVSTRLDGIGEYYFSKKLKEIQLLNLSGQAVINLGIGSPDLPPHESVIAVLKEEASKPNVHAYQSYRGADALRNSFAKWYKQCYDVDVDAASEILPLIGSKEGIIHICMTYLNQGDQALIPNPGYPTYKSAVQLSGATCIEYNLKEENDWSIDFDELEDIDLTKVKLMWVNYPHMPTGKLPTAKLFERLVAFAKKHSILICHDNPYSFILNENPMSLLATTGAKEVAIELNSLSKSHNMAGWRMGVMCGAKERIDEVIQFKSNMDSGMFLPVQLAAAKALSLGKDWFQQLNKEYQLRKQKVYELLDLLNCSYNREQVGLFVWAKIPLQYNNGYQLSDEVLNNARVFITPGGIFGSEGDNYVRVSLCSTVEIFEHSINRIKSISTK